MPYVIENNELILGAEDTSPTSLPAFIQPLTYESIENFEQDTCVQEQLLSMQQQLFWLGQQISNLEQLFYQQQQLQQQYTGLTSNTFVPFSDIDEDPASEEYTPGLHLSMRDLTASLNKPKNTESQITNSPVNFNQETLATYSQQTKITKSEIRVATVPGYEENPLDQLFKVLKENEELTNKPLCSLKK